MRNIKIPLKTNQIKLIFVILISLLWILGMAEAFEGGKISWRVVRHETGELSWHLLIFIIYISLLRKLFPKIVVLSQLLVLRKYAGLFAFFLAVFHVVAHFLKANIFGDVEQMLFHMFALNFALTFGSIALIIMLPLAIISNEYSMKKLGDKIWRRLQKITHLAFIFVGLHVAFIDYSRHGEIKYDALIILGLYFIGYIVLWIKGKRTPPIK